MGTAHTPSTTLLPLVHFRPFSLPVPDIHAYSAHFYLGHGVFPLRDRSCTAWLFDACMHLSHLHEVVSLLSHESLDFRVHAWRAADGTGLRGQLLQQSATQPELGQDLSSLNVSVQYLTPSIMRVSIGRPDRYEVPASLFKSTMPQGKI